jgi:signal transduction histidine kinase/CheY-like chemotaxis protein
MAVSAFTSLLLGVRACFGARKALSRSFALFEASVFIWCFFAAAEWMVSSPARQFDMLRLQYIGIAFVPAAFYLFARAFASRPVHGPRALVPFLPALVFVVVVVTNDAHRAFWREQEVGPLWVEPPYGWMYWLFVAYGYLQSAVSLGIIAAAARRAKGLYARWMWLVLTFFLLPFASNVVYIIAIAGRTGYDPTPISFALSGALMAAILARFDVFDPLPYAKNVILESIDTPMLVLDGAGFIVGANDEARRVFAVFGSLEGCSFSSLAPEFASTLGDRQTMRWSRDGRDYLITCYVVKRGRVDWSGRLILFRDISELSRTQRELESARRKAESAAAAKSALIAVVSHELRNPINAIIGIADLDLRRETPEAFREDLEMIRSSGRLLLGIINDLLDISKIEAGKLELENSDFDLVERIQSAERAFKSAASAKGISLCTIIDEDVPRYVRGDPLRFEQVLMNLLGNAVKFTEKGGIRVHARRLSAEQGTEVPGIRRVAIEVRDTGIGISREGRERLFKDFSQADKSIAARFGGTGLGLSISKRIVELMGGDISVESEEGVGSVFTFTVCFEPSASDRALASYSGAPRRHPAGKLRVLVVDDDPISAGIARRYLEELGHDVVCAGTAADAIGRVREGDFDAALMDIGLPDMSGLEAVTRIRGEETRSGAPRMPVAAMTASTESDLFSRCEAAGVDDLLNKPLEAAQLGRFIDRVSCNARPTTVIKRSAPSSAPPAGGRSRFIDDDALLAHLGGDESFLERLLNIFIRETPERLRAVDAAVESGDLDELRTIVHGIRGSGLTLRAGPLSLAAGALEAGILAAAAESAGCDFRIHAESLKALLRSTAEAAEKIMANRGAACRGVEKG